jgi:hypothetical protein
MEVSIRKRNNMTKPVSKSGRIKPEIFIYLLVAVFFLFYSSIFISLPGLYMDGVNPEYMISEMLYSNEPIFGKWLLPGNVLDGRFPVFSGPVYHGSVQVYATLPFLSLAGTSLKSFRFFEILVALSTILLTMFIFHKFSRNTRQSAIALLFMGLLFASDPMLAFGIRTQVYSILFPLPLLLLSWILLEWITRNPSLSGLKRYLFIFCSGLLLALAVFSYFVYVFFAPALLYILLRKAAGEQGRVEKAKIIGVWALGGAIGLIPFVLGLYLIVSHLGSTAAALQWWHTISTGLDVISYRQTILERVEGIFLQIRLIISSRWLFGMVLKQSLVNEELGVIKILIITIMFVAGLWVKPSRFRNIVLITILTVLGAGFLFQRLTSHHFVLLLPLIYMSMVESPPFKWIRAESKAFSFLVWGLYASVIVINLITGVGFLEKIKSTGGVGFYSDAINRFSNEILAEHPDSKVYFPDWGYRMPFSYLARGKVEYEGRIDPIEIRRNSCRGRESFVVFDKADNSARFQLIEELAGMKGEFKTWEQLDGTPVFQTAYFPPRSNCESASPVNGRDGSFYVLPAVDYSCNFLAAGSLLYAQWDFKNQGVDKVRIYISENGKRALWGTNEGAGSSYSTDPWAHEGMSVIFVNDNDGATLGEYVIGKQPCPIPEFEDDGSWAKPRH